MQLYDSDDILDMVQAMPEKKQLDFLVDTFKKQPTTDLDWVLLWKTTLSKGSPHAKFKATQDFIAAYQELRPKEWAEKAYADLLPIILYDYFLAENEDQLNKALQWFYNNPAAAAPVALQELENYLYLQHHPMATKFAEVMVDRYRNDLSVYRHSANFLLYKNLQHYHVKRTNEAKIKWDEFDTKLNELKIELSAEERKDIETVFSGLHSPLVDLEAFEPKTKEFKRAAALRFVRFAFDRYEIPMYAGYVLFNDWYKMISERSLPKPKSPLMADRKHMSAYYKKGLQGNRYGHSIIALFGLPYVCDFLFEAGLIDDEEFAVMRNNAEATKRAAFPSLFGKIWKFDFVMDWDPPTGIPPKDHLKAANYFNSLFESRFFDENHYTELHNTYAGSLAEIEEEPYKYRNE